MCKLFCLIIARLPKPQDGLFDGVIDALNPVNNTYRITFDRPGIGTHSVPDIDVLVCYYYYYVDKSPVHKEKQKNKDVHVSEC